jgi:hypothetical protein
MGGRENEILIIFIFSFQSDSGLTQPDPDRTGSMTAINSVRLLRNIRVMNIILTRDFT